MVNHDDDEAMARLRASDPATGSHPDLHTLRQRIAQKAPASQGADTTTRLRDDAFRGQGLHAPWVAAAAVVAFGFGAGGYAVGAQQAPGTGAPVVAGQGTDPASATSEPDGSASGPADVALGNDAGVAERGDAAMGGDSAGAAWDPGPVRLTAGPDLPTDRGTGEVRALLSDEDPTEFLDTWADRLGFEGVAPEGGTEHMFGWFSGDALYDPENGRMLQVSRDGGAGLTFNYEDMLASPWCKDAYTGIPEGEMERLREEWTQTFGPDVPFPDASRCEEPTGEAPSDEQAVAAARDFLATTGLDLSGYTLEVPEYQDENVNQVMVEGWPEGQRNGHLTVTAQVGPNGVTSAYGSVGQMASLGEYPVISAVEAVERFGQREFGMDYGVTIEEDMPAGGTEADIMPVDPPFELPEPAPLEPGAKIPLLLKDKVVTEAELTTGTMWAQTSGPLEVPTWRLTTADGMHYAVLALADEAIEWQGWGE